MNNNIAILFSDFGPYHVARIEALADALNKQGDQLFAYRFAESSTTYGWKPVVPANATVVTLGSAEPSGAKDAFTLAMALRRSLKKNKIKKIFLPSYSPLPNMLCVFGAKLAGCKLILMNESWRLTERASFFGKLVKHFLVRQFSSALVGGNPQKEYACDYGQHPEKVFLGYDVVDVNYFAKQAARWHAAAPAQLPVPNLPDRYFLNLGRFVTKKNIPTLIKAYARLLQLYPLLDIALLLVGEGAEEASLRALATGLQLPVRDGLSATKPLQNKAEVVFYPFQQVEVTPLFFTRCEAFILPSMYEEWGLVVNEAMACETAVIVSKNVGCASDLVLDGVNGFLFDPTSEEQLLQALEKFVMDTGLTKRLGTEGGKYIKDWGPARFAEGAMNAAAAAI